MLTHAEFGEVAVCIQFAVLPHATCLLYAQSVELNSHAIPQAHSNLITHQLGPCETGGDPAGGTAYARLHKQSAVRLPTASGVRAGPAVEDRG